MTEILIVGCDSHHVREHLIRLAERELNVGTVGHIDHGLRFKQQPKGETPMINTNLNRVMSALAAIWAGDPLGLNMGSPRKAKRRPTGAELRNPADPFQAERIVKAQQKRERKSNVAWRNAMTSMLRNAAHSENGKPEGFVPCNLYPFYVNREVN